MELNPEYTGNEEDCLLKILIATYWPLPHIGGVSTYVDAIMAGLEDRGHEVEILAQHPGLSRYYLRKNGNMVDKSPLLQAVEPAVIQGYQAQELDITPWIAWRETEKYAFRLACQHIKLDQYDLVHTQDIISTYAIASVKPGRTPLVATIHGCLATEWIESGEMGFRTGMEQQYITLEEWYGSMSSECLILPSQWLTHRLSTFEVSHPQTHVIPYGLDMETFTNRVQREDIPEHRGKTVIACVARLVAIKGQRYLLEALYWLRQYHEDFVCLLIGDGVMRTELEDQVVRLGLQNHVEFLGDIADTHAVLSRSDIAVLPSLQDNFPFAIVEAQALGKPVVASAVGGIVEMIEDGINGFLVQPRDPAELFKKLLLLLQDRALRERQGIQAKNHATAHWDLRTMVERTLHVYEEAILASRAKTVQSDAVQTEATIPSLEFVGRLKQTYPGSPVDHDAPDCPAATLYGSARTEATRQSISGASVHLLDVTGVVLRSVETDQRGEYTIEHVPSGTYALICSLSMYGVSMKKIRMPESADVSVDFTL